MSESRERVEMNGRSEQKMRQILGQIDNLQGQKELIKESYCDALNLDPDKYEVKPTKTGAVLVRKQGNEDDSEGDDP